MTPSAAVRNREASMCRDPGVEPRWRVAIDGPSVTVVIRGTSRPAVLVPVLLWLPLAVAASAVVTVGVATSVLGIVRGHGRGFLDSPVLVLAVLAPLACLTTRSVLRCLTKLLWAWDGVESVEISPNEVRIERNAVGIRSVSTIARRPSAEPVHDPPFGLLSACTPRGTLPRPLDQGRLRANLPGRGGVLFGFDLTAAEAAAIVAEIGLIRSASAGSVASAPHVGVWP